MAVFDWQEYRAIIKSLETKAYADARVLQSLDLAGSYSAVYKKLTSSMIANMFLIALPPLELVTLEMFIDRYQECFEAALNGIPLATMQTTTPGHTHNQLVKAHQKNGD